MRKIVAALVLALTAGLGAAPIARVPVAAAATIGPKVVIVVGATHSATATYRTRADAAYAEAIKYTSNVVKVYSPSATWAKVKAAMQGASVVIYMGHGNGFPSPYRTTPSATTQNGFGLNADLNGDGKLSDYENKYYGEYYIGNEVKLAPNAVVMLHHLCYASGNSEPGHPEPTVTVAKQRADNYAAGFLRAGARAVIADGHMGPGYYIRALFTSNQTIERMWRSAPNFHNHAFGFGSVRSPGYNVRMDPEGTSSGFYRSVAGRLDMLTSDVLAGGLGPTNVDPASFVVPGNASVSVDGTPVFADGALSAGPTTSLPLDTRVRLLAASGTPEAPSFQMETHDGAAAGFVAAANLVPRDSLAARVWSWTAGSVVSPNGDSVADAVSLRVGLSEPATWKVSVRSDTDVLWSATGEGQEVGATWDGQKDGRPAPDGTYRWVLEARDGWGNVSEPRTGDVRVDTVGPSVSSLTLPAVSPALVFSPNGDGQGDTAVIGYQTTEGGTAIGTILDGSGSTVRTLSAATGAAGSITWDGRSSGGTVVPDGLYTFRLVTRDAAGNTSAPEERTVGVYTALSNVTGSPIRFFPQDDDRFAKTSTLSFTLNRAATITWRVTRPDGTTVKTIHDQVPFPAGTHRFVWNGRGDAGTYVPGGMYLSVVQAVDGQLGAVARRSLSLNAFTISSSDSTPGRGQTITITAFASEPMSGYVYLHVAQPGLSTWRVRMTKTATSTYKATITMRRSSTGTVRFRVSGNDADGRWQRTYLYLPLH